MKLPQFVKINEWILSNNYELIPAFVELNTRKEKSEMQSTNKKISFIQSEEISMELKTSRKPFNKVKKDVKEFNDEDSLLFLKEIPGKNNQNKIDERLEFLRRELKSLVRDKKSDNNLCISNESDLSDLDQIDQIKPEIFKPDYIKSLNNFEEFEESQISEIKNSEPKPLSSKTSEWLSSSIEEIDAKIQAEKEKISYPYNTPIYSELKKKLIKTSPPCSTGTKISFLNLSQQKVEELLYKSFVLQNSEVRSSRSEKNSGHIGSAKKSKYWKYRKYKNQCKKSKTERLVQTDLNKYSKYSHKGRRRELISLNSSENDVEKIIPDNILDSETVKTDWMDFDVNNYDWNEPFDLDNDCEFQSDVTNKSSEGKDVNVNNQAPKQNKVEIMKRNSSEGIQQKSVWECPVCFEQSKGQEIMATQCGHVFCKKCLENHISKVNQTCPSCRADLRDKPSITLFNF